MIDGNGADIVYCVNCDVALRGPKPSPRDTFIFQYYKIQQRNERAGKNFIEPYTYDWNGSVSHLKSHSRYGCYKGSASYNYCAKYIQLNNWEIPKDYPW
jgi:hypothetical protein